MGSERNLAFLTASMRGTASYLPDGLRSCVLIQLELPSLRVVSALSNKCSLSAFEMPC